MAWVGAMIGVVVAAAGFVAAKRVWNAATGVSVLSGVVLGLMVAIFATAQFSGAAALLVVLAVVSMLAGAAIAPYHERQAVLAVAASGVGAVVVSVLGAAVTEQPWTNFLTVAITGIALGWLARRYREDGGAAAAIVGLAFLIGLAVGFQGASRDKLIDTLASAAFAIVVSAIIFIGANKWWDLARDRWSWFGLATGAILGAGLLFMLYANRVLAWKPDPDGADLAKWLWLLGAVVGGGLGSAIAATRGATKRAVSLLGTAAAGGLLVAFWSPEYYPAMKIMPLVVWPLALAVAGYSLALLKPTTVRLAAAGVAAAIASAVAGGGELGIVGIIGLAVVAVLVAALMGAVPHRAALTGAVFGFIVGAWGVPTLGTGTIAEAILGLAGLGALVGLRIAFNDEPTPARRDRLTLKSRATIFLAPALAFIGGALVAPTIRSIYLSFLDARAQAGVGWDNYVAIFTDDGIVNLTNFTFANLVSNNFFPLAAIFIVGGIIGGVIAGRRRGQAFESNGVSIGGLAFGAFLLSFAVFALARGTIFNNMWWVIAVTTIATSSGLAIAVLADRAKFESIAKSIIFMPMAVSFVGASIIWRAMYVARDASKEQTGILNALWVGLGKLSFSPNRWILATLVIAAVVGLLYLAYRGWKAGSNNLAGTSLLLAAPLTWFVWRLLGPGIGGFAVDEFGDVVRMADGSVRAEPIQFIPDGPYNNFWLMVVLIWIQTGFAMVILSAAIKAVPSDLIEAAQVDGATEAQSFWRVTVPQILPTVGVVVTTLVVLVMKVFDIVKVMTNGNFDTQVLANEMFQRAIVEFNLGLGSALAVLLFVSVLPIMYINIRRMQEAET